MVNNSDTKVSYKGNGQTTVFPFSFPFIQRDYIKVAIYNSLTDETKTIDSDYYVDTVANAVIYPGYEPGQEPAESLRPPILPATSTITIYRQTDVDQLTDLGEKYPLKDIENMADKLTEIIQEQAETLGRAVKVPVGDPKTPEEKLTDLQNYVSDAANSAKNAATSEASAQRAAEAAATSEANAAESERIAGGYADTATAAAGRAEDSAISARAYTAPDYDNEKTYQAGDVVTYTDGNSYRALKETTGNEPPNIIYWQKVTDYVGDNFFEVDEYGYIVPMDSPSHSRYWRVDQNGYIVPIEGGDGGYRPDTRSLSAEYLNVTNEGYVKHLRADDISAQEVDADEMTAEVAAFNTLTANAVNAGTVTANDIIAGNVNAFLAESTGYGIVSGCEPSISGLTVTVSAGVLHLADGTRKEIAEKSITLDSADPTNPRIDLVYINSDGVVARVTGTAAADPSPKMLPDNAIGICIVDVAANATTGNITLKKDTSLQDSYSWIPQFRRTELSCYNQQDAAYYNGKLFSGIGEANTLVVTNVETNTNVATITLPGDVKPHCNTICFGEKQSHNDEYPLIYLTGYNGKYSDNTNLPKGTCFVYKINSDYSATLIRSIFIDFIADDLWLVGTGNRPATIGTVDFGNFIVDTDRKKLIVFTCTPTNPCTRFFEFALPSSSGTVTLTTTDIEQYWDIPLLSWPQGTAYKDGKIYSAHGLEERTTSVDVVDLSTHSIVSHIAMGDFTDEGEGIFFIDDKLFVRGSTKYHEVINYKKIDVIGKLSMLRTSKSNNIVEAINSAVDSGISLESFTKGAIGAVKFCVIAVYADENEDYFTPVKNAILSSQYADSVTKIYFFTGLATAHDGTSYKMITGWYRNDGSEHMAFSLSGLFNDQQKICYKYEYGVLTDKYAVSTLSALQKCKTRSYSMYAGTVYITANETHTSLFVHGLIGTNNILRQYILSNNNVGVTKIDNNSDNLVKVTSLGNNKYSFVVDESCRVGFISSGYVTVTS